MLRMMLVVGLFLSAMAAQGGEKYSEKSHKMSVNGTSTLHDWTADVGKVKASADISLSDGVLDEVKSMWVQVEVSSIKSEKGEDMDEKIYEALKLEDGHKTITFNMTKVTEIKKTGNGYTLKAEGTMTIAGKKKNVTMVVEAQVGANGEVTFTGTQKFIMTEYDMERPKAMLGMIKAGDEVTVKYTVTVKKG